MKDLYTMMEGLFQDGRLTAVSQEVTALSNPVPARTEGRLSERFFLYPNQARALRRRPWGWIAVDPEDGRLLQFCDCAAGDFAADLHIPLDQEIDYSAPEGSSVRELVKLNRRLAGLYQEIRAFAFADSPGQAQRQVLAEYRELCGRLWRPELRRFYEALSPEFFAWLKANA